jgi:lipoprotein-releasing system permease protein
VICKVLPAIMNVPFFIAKRIAFSGGHNPARIIIRIANVAVALSMAVMISATALIAGFKSEISKKIFEFWGHLHVSNAQSYTFEPMPVSMDQPFYPGLADLKTIPPAFFEYSGTVAPGKVYGGVKHIQVYALKPGIIRTKTEIEGIILKGIGADFDWSNLQPYLLEGRPIAFNDSAPSREVLISRQTADRLQVGVGDKFVVHFVKDRDQLKRLFQICGIYKTGLEEYDRKFALCDIRQIQPLLDWDSTQVAGFEIWIDDLRDLKRYNAYVDEEIVGDTLVSVSIRDKFPALFQWLELQDYNEYVILGLMLAVALMNMITALLVLVLERSTMIGILKALGGRDGQVRQIFLYHALVITLTGMFWGNLLGLGFCYLQDTFHFIKLNEADYYLAYAPVKIQWWVVLGLNVGTVLLTMLFLQLPSLVISRISPLRAIRFQ